MQGQAIIDRRAADARFVSQLTRSTLAMVLAGGRGSRLMQLTDWRAKPAVPFGGKFRIIDFTLSNCVNSGIRRIGVATQYKAQSLIHHLQRGWSFLDGRFDEYIDLLPAQQQLTESWYQGTADAVYQNLDLLRRHRPQFILVLSGDHVYKMDYGRMLAEHVQAGADLSIACIDVPLEEASGFGVMNTNEERRIISFAEKPSHPQPMPGRPDAATATTRSPRMISVRTSSPTCSVNITYMPTTSSTVVSVAIVRRKQPTGAMSAPSMPTGKPTWS